MDVLKVLLTAAISIIVLFLLTKLMGEKQISQMSLFDYIIGISIGSIAAEMATDLEAPHKPLTAMIAYGVIAFVISYITNKSINFRKIVTGKPIILLDNGIIYKENLKKARMDINDLLTLCRYSGYFDVSEIQTAILEHNGAISILQKSAFRPTCPNDLNINVPPKTICFVFISDGKVLFDNLKKAGKNERWLKSQISANGYKNEKEIMLLQCDNENNVTIYPMKKAPKKSDMFE